MYKEDFLQIQKMEYRILNNINMSIFHQLTTFDYIRTLIMQLDIIQDFDLEHYYNYIDNVYLFILTEDTCVRNMNLVCCILSIVYFTTIRRLYAIEETYRFIFTDMFCEKDLINQITLCQEFVFERLKQIGTCSTDIELLRDMLNSSTKEFSIDYKFTN